MEPANNKETKIGTGKNFPADISSTSGLFEEDNKAPQVCGESKSLYFKTIKDFHDICNELKAGNTDFVNANRLKAHIDKIISFLQKDERMLLGLVNSPYSYVLHQLNEQQVFGIIAVHHINVMIYSLKIALAFGVPEKRLPYIAIAALFHHVGIIGASKDILEASPDELEKGEKIRSYEQQTSQYIKRIQIDDFHTESIEFLVNLVEEDHNALTRTNLQEAMYQYAIVIHICNEFETLTHQKTYGELFTPVDAMKKMRDEMRNYFHTDIIKLFFSKLSVYPLGSFVVLSSQETAKIVEINEDFVMRPVIMIVLDSEGREKSKPVRINLREKPNLYIKKAIVDECLTEKFIDLF